MIEKGQNEAALAVLKRFRKFEESEAYVKKELKQMIDQINWDKENELNSFWGILKKPSYRKRLILACFIQVGQQICGISAINYYQTIMYKSLGIKGSLVLALAGVWGLTGPLANLFCLAFIIDRVKRRTLLLAGSIAQTADIALVMAFVAAFGG